MKEIFFNITREEKGKFSASWNDPLGGGISTQGYDLTHLEAMIKEAVLCHFEKEEILPRVKLHFP